MNYYISKILDLFFPRHCLGCKKTGTYACDRCIKMLSQTRIPPPESTDLIQTIYFSGFYSDSPLLARILKRVKYNFSLELCETVARHVVSIKSIRWDKFDCLTPIPLSEQRVAWRGFNHSRSYANEIGQLTHTPIVDLLVKHRDTPTQMGLSRNDRLNNLADAFSIKLGTPIPQNVCLVDDIYTTGSTLRECAKVLKKAGVENVFGLVIAKKSVYLGP